MTVPTPPNTDTLREALIAIVADAITSAASSRTTVTDPHYAATLAVGLVMADPSVASALTLRQMVLDDRNELRTLAEAATPGPWYVDRISDHSEGHSWHVPDVLRWRGYKNSLSCGTDEETARFIAAANPAAILALLDEIARLRAVVEENPQ